MNKRFRSKQQGMNLRKASWVCKNCEMHVTEKPEYCLICKGASFYYFSSSAEHTRYAQLKLLLNYKKISSLQTQVPFKIKINGKLICTYNADFAYKKNGKWVVEDVKPKGFTTDIFKLKKKLVEAIYKIEVEVVEM